MSVRSNTEEFIKKARVVHGDRFIYDKVDYITCSRLVTITCRIHGVFQQKPSEHLRSVGCNKCSKISKTSNSEFIDLATEVHGNQYDYSKIEYFGLNKKVEIVCSKHGAFWQIPKSHIKGYGCRFCGYEDRSITIKKGKTAIFDKFIIDAKIIHGDKYDYSKVIFEGLNKDVELTCKEHGSFFIRPSNHLANQGCRVCSGITTWTTESFIKASIDVHGDLYDYSKVVFKNVSEKVEIICKEHGGFSMRPLKHLYRKDKCPKCSKNFKKTREDVLMKFKEVHGDTYEYILSDFTNTNDYTDIVCRKHGVFNQSIVNHMQGRGCRDCGYDIVDVFRKESYVKNCIENYNGVANLYLIRCFNENEDFYKIGITCKDTISKRFPRGTHMPYSYEEILFLPSKPEIVWDSENTLHEMFSSMRYEPNIVFGGSKTECFKFDDLNLVKNEIFKILNLVNT